MVIRKILALLATLPLMAWASSGGAPPLDRAPVDLHDKVSLQRGAQIFVNQCLGCHSASAMRYNRLEDLGLTEAQIKENLLFTGEKIGETMAAGSDLAAAKAAFGVPPPDLSLAARSRSPDWIYTYMRSFYRDPSNKTGWNNTVFPNVAMPHALWQYQGTQVLQVTQKQDPNTGDMKQTRRLVLERPGSMTPVQYDQYVGDLVNFLTYMGEPAQADRKKWGILVLFFLAGFFLLAYMLKTEYWKDVR